MLWKSSPARWPAFPLPLDPYSDGALDAAVDEVRDRYGSAALTRAVLLGRGEGMTMPMLPD